MDSKTQETLATAYSVRAKVRKALARADGNAPKALTKALTVALLAAEEWVSKVNPYSEQNEDSDSDSDTDTGVHAEVQPVAPKVRKNSTRIEPITRS